MSSYLQPIQDRRESNCPASCRRTQETLAGGLKAAPHPYFLLPTESTEPAAEELIAWQSLFWYTSTGAARVFLRRVSIGPRTTSTGCPMRSSPSKGRSSPNAPGARTRFSLNWPTLPRTCLKALSHICMNCRKKSRPDTSAGKVLTRNPELSNSLLFADAGKSARTIFPGPDMLTMHFRHLRILVVGRN